MGASPARRQCRSMRPRSLVAPNATQKARPENLVVAATAIAEASPFPRHCTKTPRECPGGREGTTEASGHRDSGRAGRPKEAGGRCPGRCPRAKRTESDRRRAKTPINRRKSRLRRRAAPNGDAYLRDSTLDGRDFIKTELGQAIFGATAQACGPLMAWFPQALLYGFWQSHLGKKRHNSKHARAWVSEIIGWQPAATDTPRTEGRRPEPEHRRGRDLQSGRPYEMGGR